MPKFDFSRLATVAGVGLVAVSVIVGSGFALLALSELLTSWR